MDPVKELKTRAEILHRSVQKSLEEPKRGRGREASAGAECLTPLGVHGCAEQLLPWGDPVLRLQRLPQWSGADRESLRRRASEVRRKHCLAIVARESGFRSWQHAVSVLTGECKEADFGDLMYGRRVGGALNCWCSEYAEAKGLLDDASTAGVGSRRFLLAYRRQFFLCEDGFISALGMDPNDSDWKAIGWNWARPLQPLARRRLYACRLVALRSEAGA